ncbi:hypothetical protein HPB51_010602 [Rhipicephalus microplus]|uniref:Regulatory protein zeste n=1 Tax=Rhipicephalus microplus TaxID=6941 RepID=A0A9J6EN79_RHIMP|nr:hypothetical protein HPB51_010602 [Rhipicephalus microplus]
MSFNEDRGVARDGRKTTATRFVFTREEGERLVNLVMRHKAIIENKRTNALSKRAKDRAWEKLTREYNSQLGIRRVTVAQMRKLGDNEKSGWKKKQSEKKINCHATARVVTPQVEIIFFSCFVSTDKTFADYTAESLRALALTSVFS